MDHVQWDGIWHVEKPLSNKLRILLKKFTVGFRPLWICRCILFLKKIFSVPDLLCTAIAKFNKICINRLCWLVIRQFEFSATWSIFFYLFKMWFINGEVTQVKSGASDLVGWVLNPTIRCNRILSVSFRRIPIVLGVFRWNSSIGFG